MDFETINVLADAKQVKIIKEIIDTLKEKIPDLVVSPFQFGKLGDDTMVTFKIERKQYQLMIEKLVFNSIRIVTMDEKSKQSVEIAKAEAKKSSSLGSLSGKNLRDQAKLKRSLDEMINEGDYLAVINTSRDVTLPSEETERAKKHIDTAILKAINTAYSDAVTRKLDIFRNIEKLVKIASDNNIRIIHKTQYLRQAGLYAIEICAMDREYIGSLINICSNNTLDSLVNVKAAIKFAQVVFKDKVVYKNELYNARKNLNTRWLNIAYLNVEKDISEEEKRAFKYLVDYLRN